MKEHIQILYGLICKNIVGKGTIVGLALAILVSISITPFVSPMISNTINENNTDILIVVSKSREELTIVVPVPGHVVDAPLRITIVNLGNETITLKKGVIIGDKGEMSTQLSGKLKGANVSMEDYKYYINLPRDEAIYLYYYAKDKRYIELVDKMKGSEMDISLNYDDKILTSYNLSSEESAGKVLKRKIIIYYEKGGEIKKSELEYEIKLEHFNRTPTPVTPEEEKIYLGGPRKKDNATEEIIEKTGGSLGEQPPRQQLLEQRSTSNDYIIAAIILTTVLLTIFVIWYKKFKR